MPRLTSLEAFFSTHFHFRTDAVTRPHRFEKLAAFHREEGQNRVCEQPPRHRGGKGHRQMTGADSATVGSRFCVFFVEEQRHVVAHELAELEMVFLRDRPRRRKIALTDLEILPVSEFFTSLT